MRVKIIVPRKVKKMLTRKLRFDSFSGTRMREKGNEKGEITSK